MNGEYEKRKAYLFKKLNDLVNHTNDWEIAQIKRRAKRLKNYKAAMDRKEPIKNEVIWIYK